MKFNCRSWLLVLLLLLLLRDGGINAFPILDDFTIFLALAALLKGTVSRVYIFYSFCATISTLVTLAIIEVRAFFALALAAIKHCGVRIFALTPRVLPPIVDTGAIFSLHTRRALFAIVFTAEVTSLAPTRIVRDVFFIVTRAIECAIVFSIGDFEVRILALASILNVTVAQVVFLGLHV